MVVFFQADEGYLDFGDIVVGSSASKHITIFNNSICSLHYRLLIDQTMDGLYPEEITKDDKIGIGYEKKNMLNSAEHEIFPARKC